MGRKILSAGQTSHIYYPFYTRQTGCFSEVLGSLTVQLLKIYGGIHGMYEIVSRMDTVQGRSNRTGIQKVGIDHLRSRSNPGFQVQWMPDRTPDIFTGGFEEREQAPTNVTAGASEQDKFFTVFGR